MPDTAVLPRGLRVAAAWLDQIRQATGAEPDPATIARITADCHRDRPCRDCAAPIGQSHEHGCDVERCMYTGTQWIGCGGWTDAHGSPLCDCDDAENYDADGYTIHVCGLSPHDCGSQVWDGVWPGVEECVEYGLYCWFEPGVGFHGCGPEHPQASPDLNTINGGLSRWDRGRGRFVLEPGHAAYLRGKTRR